MRARELADRLIQLADLHGDLEVGVFNDEFLAHGVCEHVYFQKANRDGSPHSSDDDLLGEVFIGIKS